MLSDGTRSVMGVPLVKARAWGALLPEFEPFAVAFTRLGKVWATDHFANKVYLFK